MILNKDNINNPYGVTAEVKRSFEAIGSGARLIHSVHDRSKRNHWETLFEFYNDHHDKELKLNCMPCYAKVYGFILQALKLDRTIYPEDKKPAFKLIDLFPNENDL